MGNMVVFAVRHKELAESQDLADQLVNAVSTMMSSHVSPVFFSEADKIYDSRMHVEGLVVSGYYHADSTTYTLISGECLTELPLFLGDRFSVQGYRKELSRKMQNRGIMPRESSVKKASGGSYSVFGLLTDRLSDFERNPKISSSLIKQQCLGFGDFSNPLDRHACVQFLGTFGPESAVIVKSYANTWSCLPVPHVDLSLSSEDILEISKIKEDSSYWRLNVNRYIFENVLMPSLYGVLRSPNSKKRSELEKTAQGGGPGIR